MASKSEARHIPEAIEKRINAQNVQRAVEGDALRLENQLCFPLYAASKEVVRRYKPLLDELDLTYTQYIAMMVMWEKKQVTVKDLGRSLFLDSGTLTPLLKKLEAKGFVTRERSDEDGRNLMVTITPEGEALHDKALSVPERMSHCIKLDGDDQMELYLLLYKLLGTIENPA